MHEGTGSCIKRNQTTSNRVGGMNGITKAAIRRMARRGGVKHISGDAYSGTRGVIKLFLGNLMKDIVTHTEHACRKTVTTMDVTCPCLLTYPTNPYN